MYLVVAYTKDRFHEVVRMVPKDPLVQTAHGPYDHERWTLDGANEKVVWPTIKLFPYQLVEEELVHVDGAEKFQIDLTGIGGMLESWRLPAFDIETEEVSVGDYRRSPKLILPAGLANNLPMSLTWNWAMCYAEARGLRLPDLLEVEFLATAGGTQKYPWGNTSPPADNWDFSRPLGVETHDRLTTDRRIRGLTSGVFEWTQTHTLLGCPDEGIFAKCFVVRGGPPEKITNAFPLGPFWASVHEVRRPPGVGVRCARSPKPRLTPDDFLARLP
jgi:hypothetical protein